MLNRISHLLAIGALIFGLSFLITSCRSVRIIKSEKLKVLPGVPMGTPVFRYVLDIKIYEATKFNSIKINDLEQRNSFSVTDLKTILQSNNEKVCAPGNYRLQLDVSYKLIEDESIDKILLAYRQNDKSLFIKKKVKLLKTIRLK